MSEIDYGPFSRGEYFVGECKYMDACPDIKKLGESKRNGNINEDLAEQCQELCLVGGRCLIKKSLEEKLKIETK